MVECDKNRDSTNENIVVVESLYTLPEIKTIQAKEDVFHHDILTNGQVVCSNYIDAYFNSADVITNILVKNGDFVKKGDTLAIMDKFQAEIDVEQAIIALDRAELDLKDNLIGLGYNPQDLKAVPGEIISLTELRSGLKSARLNLKRAEKDLELRNIISPLNGIVANVNQIQGNKAQTNAPFCRIMSTHDMDVKFKIIETELPLISLGDVVNIYQNNGSSVLKATITEINPIIESDGQIEVRAKILNPVKLVDGQNVRVSIERDITKTIVIPKSSVVMRDHKPVVFTLQDDSTVQWNYVDVIYENLTEYAVDGIKEGMEVIISGNKNLAHGTRVKKVN